MLCMMEKIRGSVGPWLRRSLRFVVLLALTSLVSCASTHESRRDESLARARLGNALVKQGQVAAGLRELTQAANLAPDDPRIQQDLALAFRAAGCYQKAVQHLELALRLRPRFPEAWNNLGTVYLLEKKYDQAISCFEKAASDILYETPHFAWNNIGYALFKKGDYEQAEKAFQKALALAPDYIPAHLNMARLMEAQGRWKAAALAYEAALRISPEAQPIYLGLAKVCLKKGQNERAQGLLRHAIQLGPDTPEGQEAQQLLQGILKNE